MPERWQIQLRQLPSCRREYLSEVPPHSLCTALIILQYCSSDCQKAHWPIHKTHCKSSLNSESWKPGWILQNRTPTFAPGSQAPPQNRSGGDTWILGSVPALDVLKLGANEGESYRGKLSLLFAGTILLALGDGPANLLSW